MSKEIYLVLALCSLCFIGCSKDKGPAKEVAKQTPNRSETKTVTRDPFGSGIDLGMGQPESKNTNDSGFGLGGTPDVGTIMKREQEERAKAKTNPPDPKGPSVGKSASKTKTPVPDGPKKIDVIGRTFSAGSIFHLLELKFVGQPNAPQIRYEWATSNGNIVNKADIERDLIVFFVPQSGKTFWWTFHANCFDDQSGSYVESSTTGTNPPKGKYKCYAFLCTKFKDWESLKVTSNIIELTFER